MPFRGIQVCEALKRSAFNAVGYSMFEVCLCLFCFHALKDGPPALRIVMWDVLGPTSLVMAPSRGGPAALLW
jgi:hypothetical protein